MQDDVADVIPDLPFSEEEWYQAYKRLYSDAEARDYAKRLAALPRQLREEAREKLKGDPQHPIPLLHIDHDVLAMLATVSAQLERRVGEYMEARFVEAAMNYRRGIFLKRGLAQHAEPPDDVREEVRRFHDELRQEWSARVRKARERAARPMPRTG